jgi:hypothetical protein
MDRVGVSKFAVSKHALINQILQDTIALQPVVSGDSLSNCFSFEVEAPPAKAWWCLSQTLQETLTGGNSQSKIVRDCLTDIG